MMNRFQYLLSILIIVRARPCDTGPLFKFINFNFAHGAAGNDDAKQTLSDALKQVRSGAQKRVCVRNVEMLTLADGLPVRRHFDWFVGRHAGGEAGKGGAGGGAVGEDVQHNDVNNSIANSNSSSNGNSSSCSNDGGVLLMGEPCSERDTEQRAKVGRCRLTPGFRS